MKKALLVFKTKFFLEHFVFFSILTKNLQLRVLAL